MGIGWGISGLSAISRSNKTIYHDGKVEEFSFAATDALTLDGKRILYNSTTNSYQFEVEDFSEITRTGGTAASPTSFQVKLKDGIIMEYGNSTDSRFNHSNGATIVWRLNKVLHVDGNYIEYKYVNTDNDVRISEINYTGNAAAGLLPYNTIQFNYGFRYYDEDVVYIKDTPINTVHLLNDIIITSNGQPFKRYELRYDIADNLVNRLFDVVEKGAAGTSLNSTIFKYGDVPSSPLNVQPFSALMNNNRILRNKTPMDFNGDGYTDFIAEDPLIEQLIALKNNPQTNTLDVVSSVSFGPNNLFSNNQNSINGSYNYLTSDFTGDGLDDVVIIEAPKASTDRAFNEIKIYKGGEVPFSTLFATIPNPISAGRVCNFGYKKNSYLSGDFDGDGVEDILLLLSDRSGYKAFISFPRKGIYNQEVSIPSINSTYPASVWVQASRLQIVDINGDGKKEIAILNVFNSSFDALIIYDIVQLGSTWTAQVKYSNNTSFKPKNLLYFGDFNGDGKTDIIRRHDKSNKNSNWAVFTSTGSAFAKSADFVQSDVALELSNTDSYINTDNDASTLLVSDFDGDGKHDVIHRWSKATTSNNVTTLTTGTDIWFFSFGTVREVRQLGRSTYSRYPENSEERVNFIEFMPGDYNGDGRTDWLEIKNLVHCRLSTYKANSLERLLRKAKDGHGLVQEWDYVKMNQCYSPLWDYSNNKMYIPLDYWASEFGPSGPSEPSEPTINPCDYSIYRRKNITEYPVNTVKLPMTLVKSFSSYSSSHRSNVQYIYEDAKLHREGKGLLGFMSIKSRATNLKLRANGWVHDGAEVITETKSKLDNVYYNLIPDSSKTQRPNGRTLLYNKTATVVEAVNLPNRRYWYKNTRAESYDELSNGYSRVNNTYDDYGNITTTTNVLALASDPGDVLQSGSTVTTYAAFASARNLPNKPTRITMTKTRKGQTSYSASTEMDYTSLGQLKKSTTFPGLTNSVVTEFRYSGKGNLIYKKTTAPNYTPALPILEETMGYDTEGRFLESVTNPVGQVSSIATHPLWGKPSSTTGIDGLVTSYTYDEFGRLMTTTTPDGVVTTEAYNFDINAADNTLQKHTRSQTGRPTLTTYYDAFNRETKSEVREIDNSNNVTIVTSKKTYNEHGLVETFTNTYKPTDTILVTTNSYDLLQRITSINHPLGTSTASYVIDALGNTIITTTDIAGKVTSKKTDLTGLTTQTTDNINNILTYTYDSQGNNTTVTGNGVAFITNTYDGVYGTHLQSTDISAGTTKYKYDAYKRLIEETSPLNQVTRVQYNTLGQVITKTLLEGTIRYNYHPVGSASVNKLATVEVQWLRGLGRPSESYLYDNLGRLQSKTISVDGILADQVTTYEYYANSDLEQTNYPSGLGIKNWYFPDGRLWKTTNAANTQLIYQVDANNGSGNVTNYTLGNGISSSVVYNRYGLPTLYKTDGIQNLAMNWGDCKTGNLFARTNNTANTKEIFAYDNLDRLTSAEARWISNNTLINTINTSFAPNGNIATKTEGGTYASPANKHNVTKVSNQAVFETMLNQDITYTSFKQPRSLTEGVYNLEYTYGADLQRIKGVLSSGGTAVNTRYYFGDYEINRTSAGDEYIHYTTGAIIVKPNLAANTETYYFTYTDHLGSILTVTDKTGTIIAQQNFDAWGRKRDPSTLAYLPRLAPLAQSWLYRGYTGHEHLPQFGLINMNARLYDPVLGRMLSPDNFIHEDAGLNGYNRYSYALNNPLKFTDPDGNLPFLAVVAIGAAVFGALNVATNAMAGNIHNFGDGLKAFAVGAVVGAGVTATIGGGIAVGGLYGAFSWGMIGVYGGATAVNTVVGLGHGVFGGDWSKLANAGKLFMGQFHFDNNRNPFAAMLQGVTRFTWEGLQSSIGYGFNAARNSFGDVDRVEYFGGMTYSINNRTGGGGVSIGNNIGIWEPGGFSGGDFRNHVLRINQLYMHEYGHSFDSQLFGVSYLFAVGIPSLIDASSPGGRNRDPRDPLRIATGHDFYWTERRANSHAKGYFSRFGITWNEDFDPTFDRRTP